MCVFIKNNRDGKRSIVQRSLIIPQCWGKLAGFDSWSHSWHRVGNAMVSLSSWRWLRCGEAQGPRQTHAPCARVKCSGWQGKGNAMCNFAFFSSLCFGGWVTAVKHQLRQSDWLGLEARLWGGREPQGAKGSNWESFYHSPRSEKKKSKTPNSK